MRKKLVESSLGVKTTEDMARTIDAALKTLPKDAAFQYRRKAATDTEVQPGQRTDVSTITTAHIDRDQESVLPAGFVLDEYRANPIVLFGHDQDRPVGRCLWIKSSDKGLVAKTQYPDRPDKFVGDWLPDFVFSMVQAEVLKGKSVGFLPLDIRDPTAEELAAAPDLQRVITRALLVEYSVVSIPSNPEALVEAVGKGLGWKQWGFKVVGKVKPKKLRDARPADVAGPMAEALKLVTLDPDRIAEEAIKNILKSWEV